MRGRRRKVYLLLVERITQQGWSLTPAAQAAGLSTNPAHHRRAR
jgi:hypothetical protein